MSNLVEHAEQELRLAGFYDEGADYGDMMPEAILEIVEKFSEQGHSGFSASLALSILTKLLDFQPLTPLTGADDEWTEVADGVFQNKRCSHVFKQSDRFDGKPYDIDGRIFREPNGCCYQNGESFVVIEFPYTPKREYVDVPASEEEYKVVPLSTAIEAINGQDRGEPQEAGE